MLTIIIIGAIILLLGILIVAIYNELTKERILVEEAWSVIGTFLQQRNDTIPNMVEIVKGYAGHENKTLVEVTRWRNSSAEATTPAEQQTASQGLQRALMNLYSVAENYPELKANENFLRLQGDLTDIEEKINQSRRYYNGTVREYNQSIAVIPKNAVASIFGFQAKEFFAESESSASA
ncbi:MAG: LemA family protein, partial [Candidatus Kapabacteria bacterium]|nr:LemA family protein [Candidatus Kapabacteria bacterium]